MRTCHISALWQGLFFLPLLLRFLVTLLPFFPLHLIDISFLRLFPLRSSLVMEQGEDNRPCTERAVLCGHGGLQGESDRVWWL